MIFRRRTLAEEAVFEGRGLHSGLPVTVTVRPSESGIVFRLGNQKWEARPANVTDTSRCTRLGEISTIEHLMSAFCGLEITDADVEVSAPEMPGMDGAAQQYVEGLTKAGFAEGGEVERPNLFARVFVPEKDAKIAVSDGTGCWRYEFTAEPWPGLQVLELEDLPQGYADQIAPARTFAFEHEMEMIRQAGLGRGLDETTAFVIGQAGYLNAVRFNDEPVRHKMLDAMGDLYLAGVPARFLNVVAERTGHRATVKAAQLLYESTVAHG